MPHAPTNTHRANRRRIPAPVHYSARPFADASCGARFGCSTSNPDAVTCAGCRATMAVAA